MTAAAAENAGKDVKGLYLLTDYPAAVGAPRNHIECLHAAAELRSAAGAFHAVGRRYAARLDRDPARRRPAGGGRHAGDRPERQPSACASTFRPMPAAATRP